ncbi:MAG: TRAM domain-containing protein [Planctomycetota bacterium]|nr:TRAM domain-containing protein [Planctomycetota bacterium]
MSDLDGSKSTPAEMSTPPRHQPDSEPEHILLLSTRLVYVVLMIAVSTLPFISIISPAEQGLVFWDYAAPVVSTTALAAIVLLLDILNPRKRLANVFGLYLAIVAGLFAALAVGALIDLIADAWGLDRGDSALKYLTLLKLAVGLTLCYLAVSIVLTTKDNIRMVIPYVEFSRQVRGVRPMLLDSSALIDGRINSFSQTGFLDAPLIVPQYVIDEMHQLADSSDAGKRERGRRGLNNLRLLQDSSRTTISIEDTEQANEGVDQALLALAGEKNFRIVTTDFNLTRVADIRDVATLNLNDLSGLLRGNVVPGESMTIVIIRAGESEGQGIGYLPDGTMVVVENANRHIGQEVVVVINNSVQTTAGRLVFARIDEEASESGASSMMADAATSQPKQSAQTRPDKGTPRTGRNPRR